MPSDNNTSPTTSRLPLPFWVWWVLGVLALPSLTVFAVFVFLFVQVNRKVAKAHSHATLRLTLNNWEFAWTMKPKSAEEPVRRIVHVHTHTYAPAAATPPKRMQPKRAMPPVKKPEPSREEIRLTQVEQMQAQWQQVLERQHTRYIRMLSGLQRQTLQEAHEQLQQWQRKIARTLPLQNRAGALSKQLVQARATMPDSARWQLHQRLLKAQEEAAQSLPVGPRKMPDLELLESDFPEVAKSVRRCLQQSHDAAKQLADVLARQKEAARLAPSSPLQDRSLPAHFAHSYARAYGPQLAKAGQAAEAAGLELTFLARRLQTADRMLQETIARDQQNSAPRTFVLPPVKSFEGEYGKASAFNRRGYYLLVKEMEEQGKVLYNRSLIYDRALQDRLPYDQAAKRVALLPLSTYRIPETNDSLFPPNYNDEIDRIYQRVHTQRFKLQAQQKRYGLVTLAQAAPVAAGKIPAR